MSTRFIDGKVYIIIPAASITQTMINYSTSPSASVMPTKTVTLVDYKMLETAEPVNSVFNDYVWYSKVDAPAAWDAL